MLSHFIARPFVVGVLGLRSERGCRLSVGLVAVMSLNSCSRPRLLALFILTLPISCSARLYFGCVSYVSIVRRRFNFDVHINFYSSKASF